MNPEEIQEAAKEAGLYNNELDLPEVMQNFAAIIEKRTIERCAVVCEQMNDSDWSGNQYAAAIRKLGEQE